MEEVLETFTWPANVPYKAFWGMSSGQVNVTRMGFAESIR